MQNTITHIRIRRRKKVKCKVVSGHAIKAYRGSRGIAPLFLKLDTRWRRVVNFTPWPLYSWEGTRVPIE